MIGGGLRLSGAFGAHHFTAQEVSTPWGTREGERTHASSSGPESETTRRSTVKVTQISSFIENRPGRLHAACEALAARGVNIHTLMLADTAEFGILRLIVADPAAGKAALESAGYIAHLTEVVAVEVPDDAGGLTRVLTQIDGAGLDIEYMYAFSTAVNKRAVVIMRFSDADRAVAELQARGVNLVAPLTLLQG